MINIATAQMSPCLHLSDNTFPKRPEWNLNVFNTTAIIIKRNPNVVTIMQITHYLSITVASIKSLATTDSGLSQLKENAIVVVTSNHYGIILTL